MTLYYNYLHHVGAKILLPPLFVKTPHGLIDRIDPYPLQKKNEN